MSVVRFDVNATSLGFLKEGFVAIATSVEFMRKMSMHLLRVLNF